MKQSLFRFWATPTFSTGSQRAIITTPRGGFLALFLPLFSVQLIRLTCLNTVESTASLSTRPLTTDKPSETSSCVIFSLLFSLSLSLFSKVVITHRHQCNDFAVQCAWQKEECFKKTEDSSQVDICTHFYFQRLQRQESGWRQTSIGFYSYLLFLRFSLFLQLQYGIIALHLLMLMFSILVLVLTGVVHVDGEVPQIEKCLPVIAFV